MLLVAAEIVENSFPFAWEKSTVSTSQSLLGN